MSADTLPSRFGTTTHLSSLLMKDRWLGLGALGNLERLAIQERCGVVLRHIAVCGRKVEPANRFWAELLALLPRARNART